MDWNIFLEASLKGWYQIQNFMAEFLIGAFLPAFLISGAIKVFISERRLTYYLGPDVNPMKSYSIASVAGILFSACSCGVIPLFASIFRHGAGIGPAMVFLTTGPAINLLAIILTGQMFGFKMMSYRTFFAIVHGFIMGFIFAWLYRKEDHEHMVKQGVPLVSDELVADREYNSLVDEELDEEYIKKPASTVFWLFFWLVVLMCVGQIDTNKVNIWIKLGLYFLNIAVLAIYTFKYFKREEYMYWFERTGHFIYKILKPLIIGLFFIGFLEHFVTKTLVIGFVGVNDVKSCTVASVIGAFMYFGTCVSVVIVKFLKEFGMADGPALSLFLAGPTVSLPSMLALITIMGYKKTAIFTLVIIVLSMVAGLTY